MIKNVLRAFVFAALLFPGPAPAQTYQQWNNPDSSADERLQGFIDQLNTLIDAAERQRAADPGFLRDLRGLTQTQILPRRVQLLSDDFSDGDFTRNPRWTVTSGQYWVESGWGLRSAVKAEAAAQQPKRSSNKDLAAAIFGQILQQAIDPDSRASGGSQTSNATTLTPAAIQTPLRLSNGFSITVDFSSWVSEGAPAGRFEIGPYQGTASGGARASGYVLAYTQGGRLELIRVTGRGSSVIDSRPGPFRLEDKKTHQLEWTRQADGLMTVSLDGREILTASDNTFKQNFDGLRLVNRGGDYIVKRLNVTGTP